MANAKRLLLAQLALAVLAGLLQHCSGMREGASVVTPKLLKLKEQQAEKDAEWKPVREIRCCREILRPALDSRETRCSGR
eukprot:COSAG02_NODE_588_length_19902_cov_115.928900_13_plen_80_part_00